MTEPRRSTPRKGGTAVPRAPVGAQGSTTRSSRWTTSWGSPSGSSAVWRPGDRPERRGAGTGPGPWRTARPSAPTISTASSTSNAPSTAADAGGEQRPAVVARARGARRRRRRPARGAARERDPAACGSGAARGAARNDGADRAARRSRRRPRRARRPPRSPRARPTTPRSSRPRACSPCRRSPRSVPAPPATRLERGVDLDDLLDQRRVGVEARDRR